MDELRKELLREIVEIYGPMQGQGIGAIIIPAFIGDFRKVLEKDESFGEISEEYMTEDKKVHLLLEGRKILGRKGYSLKITGCEVNGRRLTVDGNCLYA